VKDWKKFKTHKLFSTMEVECELLTWERIYALCLKLSQDIIKSGYTPDAIVAVGRGGWIPARILSDFLNLRELYSVKAEYWDVAKTRENAMITQPINVDINGKKILVVDDVADTGETLSVVVSHLRKAGAGEIKSAVLQYKKTSVFAPDYCGEVLKRWVWIVYPWGVVETILGFLDRIDNVESMSDAEVAEEMKKRFNLEVTHELVALARGKRM
jgi:hypothetical protein